LVLGAWNLYIEDISMEQPKPLTLSEFPKAIIHIDGDCFFASCEIALNPKLKGLPVVTGKERGIASSMSYEAKAAGVTRGMNLRDIKRMCPGAVILPSDYETYSLFSVRMFNIVRRYTPQVEEYSIDECFADLTGLQRPLNLPYETMAQRIKSELDNELGMTFSVGLAPTKVLAKVGSKWEKPSGLTIIPGHDAHLFLGKLPLEKIWGIGPATSNYLYKYGLKTALDFARQDEQWVKDRLTKPHREIWQELRGTSVYPVMPGTKDDYKSISKTKTFTPASQNRELVFSQLSKNIENACVKARRHGLASKKFFFFLKTQDFKYLGGQVELDRATNIPQVMVNSVRKYFDWLFDANISYRATGVTMADLGPLPEQLNLFGAAAKTEKFEKIYGGIDKLSEKFGKHAVFLGSSFAALAGAKNADGRNAPAPRTQNLFKGETARKRIGIPLLRNIN
jgi:DNA polymerase IV